MAISKYEQRTPTLRKQQMTQGMNLIKWAGFIGVPAIVATGILGWTTILVVALIGMVAVAGYGTWQVRSAIRK